MADNFVLGMSAKLYRSAALLDGVTVTPTDATWVEIDNVRDVSISLSAGETDITTRANSGWAAKAATLKEAGADFEMLWKKSDTNLAAVRDAFLNSTEIALLIIDHDKDGAESSEGLVANFVVTEFSVSQPLADAQMASVSVRASSQIEWFDE